MALVKYKILQAPINDGVSYVPEKAIPLGVWTLQEPVEEGEGLLRGQVPLVEYKVNLAFMMTYADWAEQFPDEAKEEASREEGSSSA